MRRVCLAVLAVAVVVEAQETISCTDRCQRIHSRSLERAGYSPAKAETLLEKQRPEQPLRQICWKMYDYFYCMKGCPKTRSHEKYVRHVKGKCAAAVEDLDAGLSCLSRYRSFLEIRCSSFMNEAIRLKKASDPEMLPSRETCRYLHLNALCLENSVGSFCPLARPFFRRLNLRDFFLNFVLPPAEDDLFDEQDLDACQMKDFVKEALDSLSLNADNETERVTSSTASTSTSKVSSSSSSQKPFIYTSTRSLPTAPIHIRAEDAFRGQPSSTRTITITPYNGKTRVFPGRVTTVVPPLPSSSTTAPTERKTTRRVFESQEDLANTPPNFHYSSYRESDYAAKHGVPHNYSMSFPADTQFVTPVDVHASTIFGIDSSEETSTEAAATGRLEKDSTLPPVTVDGGEGDKGEYILIHDESSTIGVEVDLIATASTTQTSETEERQGEEGLTGIYSHRADELLSSHLQESTPMQIETTPDSSEDGFTPLINGGRVAVKSIKSFGAAASLENSQDAGNFIDQDDSESADSLQEWPEDSDDYLYVTSKVEESEEEAMAAASLRQRFILVFIGLFLLFLGILSCCIFRFLLCSRRHSAGHSYKLHHHL